MKRSAVILNFRTSQGSAAKLRWWRENLCHRYMGNCLGN